MPPSRRDELVDAAMRVFYRHGFHASGLDRILEESGISRMTIYNHFKSKDELILAALRRRDEIFRNKMMQFVESKADTPTDRLLAVFDFHEAWFTADDFCGCMFINASAEFADPTSPPRQIAHDHKRAIARYLTDLATLAGLTQPTHLAAQLNLLLDGAIVSAHISGQMPGNKPSDAARLAKDAAKTLIHGASGS